MEDIPGDVGDILGIRYTHPRKIVTFIPAKILKFRTESLRRVEEAHQVKNLVGEFEGLANRNKARPVYPDHYTQKKSPKTWGAPKVIKIEKTDRSEPEYLHQEKVSRQKFKIEGRTVKFLRLLKFLPGVENFAVKMTENFLGLHQF